MDSDFLLIQRMRGGDEQSVECFVKKYYPKILKYCCLHLPDYGHAEDATQETFEAFFRTFHAYRHYGKALNYLYVIAANKCRDFYNRESEPALEEAAEQPDSQAAELTERLEVRLALERLPPEIRETAILFFFQQMKQREIAKVLGIGLPLVKYRVRKAKELLASYLREEELL